MNAEYKKAAKKLLCGITDKRLHEPTIWNDILSSACSGKLRLWEINDEILRINFFCFVKLFFEAFALVSIFTYPFGEVHEPLLLTPTKLLALIESINISSFA